VKIRPVRLPPCAAGASPAITTRGAGSPQPATGRPQYGWSANDRRLVVATSSRHSTSRGHARHTETIASNSAGVLAFAASRTTSAASAATGVRRFAGSSGQPVPGGTGLSNG
jgi:hypothetical protein